ncbi:hypothetical protein LguiB_025134 [Lonicera macranthoides]
MRVVVYPLCLMQRNLNSSKDLANVLLRACVKDLNRKALPRCNNFEETIKEESKSLLLCQVFSLYTFYVPVVMFDRETDFD